MLGMLEEATFAEGQAQLAPWRTRGALHRRRDRSRKPRRPVLHRSTPAGSALGAERDRLRSRPSPGCSLPWTRSPRGIRCRTTSQCWSSATGTAGPRSSHLLHPPGPRLIAASPSAGHGSSQLVAATRTAGPPWSHVLQCSPPGPGLNAGSPSAGHGSASAGCRYPGQPAHVKSRAPSAPPVEPSAHAGRLRSLPPVLTGPVGPRRTGGRLIAGAPSHSHGSSQCWSSATGTAGPRRSRVLQCSSRRALVAWRWAFWPAPPCSPGLGVRLVGPVGGGGIPPSTAITWPVM